MCEISDEMMSTTCINVGTSVLIKWFACYLISLGLTAAYKNRYVQSGDKVLMWNTIFPSLKIYQVNMLFPWWQFVWDIQWTHMLVGIFDLYSQVERPCISCDSTFDNLNNFQVYAVQPYTIICAMQ